MSRRIITLAIITACLAFGCDDASTGDTSSDTRQADAASDTTPGDATSTDATVGDTAVEEDSASTEVIEDIEEVVDRSPLGEGVDRPARVVLPRDYSSETAYPLVTLLHGYSASGTIQDIYFSASAQVNALDFILIIPEGTTDSAGNQFWNATPGCCDFNQSNIDDVGYLWSLVEEAQGRYNIDPARISYIGHSNGGFMSYRMACERGDAIASIVSLAGATYLDPEDCANAGQVSVLQVHGELDATILYAGNPSALYPGARESASRWATRDGCDETPVDGGRLDLESTLAGDETVVETWTGCDGGREVGLWTIEDGSHIPNLTQDFIQETLGFLLDHPRP